MLKHSKASVTTPIEMLSELGVKNHEMFEEFASRKLAFSWIHLGTTDLQIGRLLDLIRKNPALLPPRSGHMGNWEEIVLGRAGVMDFNKAICAQGFGYPLIYSFNQTEDGGMQHGDWVYLPGSVVENGVRTELPLFTWDGTQFVRRDREYPLFTPFVLTEANGQRLPLTKIHWRRMKQFSEFQFRLEASVVYDHEALVRSILGVLIEEAQQQTNPRRAFQDLLSHQVSLDGRMTRADLERDGQGYRMGEEYYEDLDKLVNAAMIPFLAVLKPDAFFAGIADYPAYLPLPSNVLSGVLSAIFSAHYPGHPVDRSRMTQPFNPHFHWGARDMAGYPPVRKGYFSEKSTIKSYRKICQTIIDQFPEVDPVFMVLMPAVVFALCPTNLHYGDVERMATLILRVKESTDHLADQPDLMMDAVKRAVAEWLPLAQDGLSDYFLNRFYRRRGILNEGKLHVYSEPVEPQGFRELTFRQACMIVGALIEALTPEEA